MILYFHKCIQNSQNYNSDDDHMISEVYLSLELNSKKYDNLVFIVKQISGSHIESEPLEVSIPNEIRLKFNYDKLRNEVEKYYRELIGSSGNGIRIEGSTNIQMRNNTFVSPKTVSIN